MGPLPWKVMGHIMKSWDNTINLKACIYHLSHDVVSHSGSDIVLVLKSMNHYWFTRSKVAQW